MPLYAWVGTESLIRNSDGKIVEAWVNTNI